VPAGRLAGLESCGWASYSLRPDRVPAAGALVVVVVVVPELIVGELVPVVVSP
jgi:hypothetical protein